MSGMMGGGMMAGMGAWMLLWAAVGLVLLGAVVAAAVWLVRRAVEPSVGAHDQDPAQILRRRYAAGEIDDGEYERRLTGLGR